MKEVPEALHSRFRTKTLSKWIGKRGIASLPPDISRGLGRQWTCHVGSTLPRGRGPLIADQILTKWLFCVRSSTAVQDRGASVIYLRYSTSGQEVTITPSSFGTSVDPLCPAETFATTMKGL